MQPNWLKDFPVLDQKVHGKRLVYLDSGATALKPRSVTQAVHDYYTHDSANVHRGVHTLSERATKKYEQAREDVRTFLNAKSTREIVFTSGTTQSINLVARSFGEKFIQAGDEILISAMEHHSNIVPWQELCRRHQAQLKIIPMNQNGELKQDEYAKLLSPKTKLVALVHLSNALGTLNPVKEMTAMAHAAGAKVLLDGAQAVMHFPVDVQELNADFYAFSGHKLFAPTGVGVLYGKESLLEELPPYQFGGDMISSVSFEKTTYNELPYKFEAGTPPIASVIGLGAAIKYLGALGWDQIQAHEHKVFDYAQAKLSDIAGLRMIGTAQNKASVFSFVLEGVHPHDMGTLADQEGVAIRTGHHCAQPVMQFFKVPATARASLAFYNTQDDIDQLCYALKKIGEFFA